MERARERSQKRRNNETGNRNCRQDDARRDSQLNNLLHLLFFSRKIMVISTSLFWDLLGVVTALLVIGYAYFKWAYLYWKRRNIPYLEPSLPFGNFFNLWKRDVAFGDWIQRIYKEGKSKGYKYFGVYILSSPILIVTDLELAKHVMTKDFSNFVDRGVYTNEVDDPLSEHLFATTGKKWRNLRVKLTPTFTSGKLKAMFQTLVDCGLILEKYIEDISESKEASDVKEILGCYSTDIIGSCAFGLDCNSFKEPNSPFRVYGKRAFFQNTIETIRNIFSLNYPNIARALHLRAFPKDVTNFFKKTVEDTIAYREKNNVTRKDFLQLLIEVMNKKVPNGHQGDGNTLTMDEVAAQSFVFFLAGFETSSTTATFALYSLATHPEIQDKLREEIHRVLERHNDQITYDSLSEMKYMKQVIDGEDVIIEKDTQVFIPIIGYQHDEEYFNNPEAFDPDRFSEENKKKIPQYSNMPFGEGPRVCIGERFGIMQTKVALTCILRKSKATLNKKNKGSLGNGS
ncbi:hypothetical protein NQ314_008179 [Rhamnusium bicolor]|uniref:Cytochrome P450 n=1 Tax=Rhamnusium bicolor TaxID=1586634 RepID=A0AAV8YEV5_9CUCU|nr:hypothetical protein NQ314_008179 [Rhamnusium bicolor]